MGRIKRAWYYQRKADAAERREQFLRNREPAERNYKARESRKEAVYASISQMVEGGNSQTASQLYQVKFPQTSGLDETKLGLFTVEEKKYAFSIRNAPIYPTTVRWYKGTGNPQRMRTQWGTAWIRYYEVAEGNSHSHYSSPLSAKAARVEAKDQLKTFADAFRGEQASGLLGGKNGRAYLTLERLRGYSASQ